MPLPKNVLLYAVLIAPGFVSVMAAISLAAIEDEKSEFVILVWSMVSSVIIDTTVFGVYQWIYEPFSNFSDLTNFFFTPHFRTDLIGLIFIFSIFVGVLYSIIILVDLPEILRNIIQSKLSTKYNPNQPWENFMEDANSIFIKTTEGELFYGGVKEWSRAGRPREVRIFAPERYNEAKKDFEPIGRGEMLFLDDAIERIDILQYRKAQPRWKEHWILQKIRGALDS